MEQGEFRIFVFDKPLIDVLPLVGGYARHFSIEDDGVNVFRDLRQVEYAAGAMAPPIRRFEDVGATFRSVEEFEHFPLVFRLIEMEVGSPFCIFDTSISIHDTLGPDYFADDFCGARFIKFRYAEYEGQPGLSEMSVKIGRKVIRSVTAYQDEEDAQGKSRWKFAQYGAPQPWEDTSNYTRRQIKDRLNRDILIDYMTNFGLDFDRVARGDFHRVVEFAERSEGSTLEIYDEECKRLRRALEDYLFALTGGRPCD
ncbi:MAG: hypothetical protein KDE03_17965 [Rhodobacteraceae bacterium]|nr:hypothetical protein [Paracoccaceae bacterium]